MTNLTGITMKELMDFDFMKEAKILSGEDGLDRVIHEINVMEVPDIIDWVKKDELLLTTAYVIKDDIEKLYDLIVELDNKGVSGLGIKTHRYIKEVPNFILEKANELAFPIIEIPYELSYSSIISASLTKIISRQTELLKRVDSVQKQLLNTMLHDGGLEQIGKIICENLEKTTLAIREYVFEENIIFCDSSKENILKEILEEDRQRGNEYRLYIENNFEHFETYDNINGVDVKRYTIPICTKDRNFGAIYIWDSDNTLTDLEIRMIQSSSSFISLEILRKLSMFEVESKYKIEFFDDLFSKNPIKQNRALEKAAFFDFDKNLAYSAIVVSINTNIQSEVKHINTHLMHKVNVRILGIIQRLIQQQKRNMICGNKSDKIIILYGVEKGKDGKKLKKEIVAFANEILDFAKIESINYIKIGVGRNYEDPNSLWKSYKEAIRSIKAADINDFGDISYYSDLGIYKLLTYEELKPELLEFYEDTLSPLVKYDKEKNTELLLTLKMYFKYGGNLKRISKEMFTHYNTIIYRIQRIEEITRTNLQNNNDALNLQISIKIHAIIEENINPQ